MTDDSAPRIYLRTPEQVELSSFPDMLAAMLDSHDIACLRLSLATRDEDEICRIADALRAVAHACDVPLVLDDHARLATRLGLDGVHLTDGHRRVREVRKDLGKDAIIGSFCGASRHDGMTAAEIGIDYVSFGPVTATGLLDGGDPVEAGLFDWWSQMIEVPVVAEGGLTRDALGAIAPHVDFLCLGDEVWRSDNAPHVALGALIAQL